MGGETGFLTSQEKRGDCSVLSFFPSLALIIGTVLLLQKTDKVGEGKASRRDIISFKVT